VLKLSGESEIPASAMNPAEGGGKGQEEGHVQILVVSMFRNVENRDMCSVCREGECTSHGIIEGGKEGQGEYEDQEKKKAG
jgi:hypothetical protein